MNNRVTFINERHGTSSTVTLTPSLDSRWMSMTRAQVNRVRAELCGRKDCTCGHGPAAALCGDSMDNPIFYPDANGGGHVFVKEEE